MTYIFYMTMQMYSVPCKSGNTVLKSSNHYGSKIKYYCVNIETNLTNILTS